MGVVRQIANQRVRHGIQNKAKANGLGDEACDKEAKELRAMFGGGQTASATGKSESGQAKTYPADMKKTAKK